MHDFFKKQAANEEDEKRSIYVMNVSEKEEISTTPEAELRQEPDAYQSQNELGKYEFYTGIDKEEDKDMEKWDRAETRKEKIVEKHEKNQAGIPTVPTGTNEICSSVQGGRFEREFCNQEYKLDTNEFLKVTYPMDKLSFIPNNRVFGKGLESEIRDCKIYMRKGQEIYTYNLDNYDQTKPFNEIPQDVLFIIIGDAEYIFIAAKAEGEEKSIYWLPKDVVVAIYIETKLYKRLNHFYAYAVKDGLDDSCNVNADPRVGKDMYGKFAVAVESDLERSGLGQ